MISLGLVGYPLEHSYSPLLHQAALSALKLEGEYRLYPIDPRGEASEEVRELLEKLRQGALRGLNVTIPFKQSLIHFLDELTSEAEAIGAVNTVFSEKSRLVGDNTDAKGFSSDLKSVLSTTPLVEISGRDAPLALVLGAGGAARAVIFALIRSGWRVAVAARRFEQAQRIRERFNGFQVSSGGSSGSRMIAVKLARSDLKKLLPEIRLLVNATPVGMWPAIDRSPWPEGLSLPSGAVVYDLVYNPAETRLVRQAREAGLKAQTGLGMLIEQAALSFERWTGRTASREAMRKSIAGMFPKQANHQDKIGTE